MLAMHVGGHPCACGFQVEEGELQRWPCNFGEEWTMALGLMSDLLPRPSSCSSNANAQAKHLGELATGGRERSMVGQLTMWSWLVVFC